jgi:rhodanese-related sulfurtransferase
LLAEARQKIPEMTAREVYDLVAGDGAPVLLDVRGTDEWELERIEEAIHIPRGRLEREIEAKLPEKSSQVVVYCAAGIRSLLAAETLKEMGYQHVISMDGGFESWSDAGLPALRPPIPEDEVEEDPDLLQKEVEHLKLMLDGKAHRLEHL